MSSQSRKLPASVTAARGSRSGGRYVSGLQRGRLLSATFALVGEHGYEGLSARGVSERARVSNRRFYELFSDREDCFLAAFNQAVDGLERELRVAWESELGWTARVRGALVALLGVLDREPALRRLVVVEALAAGPRVLACRARVLEGLADVIDEGRVNARVPGGLPALVAEGVVGGTFGVIHARLLELHPEALLGLLGPLMAMIVLPYRGSVAAARELARPAPRLAAHVGRDGGALARRRSGSASLVDYRLTARTRMALVAVAGRPGLNNREVSEVIGLADQGQVSRMMRRLCEQGLIENAGARSKRKARAWRLTAEGEAVIDAHRLLKQALPGTSSGGKPAAESGRRGKHRQVAGTDAGLVEAGRFRMTALTHRVLEAVVDLRERGSNPSNRQIAELAGVKDEGQTSKLLTRLESHGLLANVLSATKSTNAWQLTPRGEQVLSTTRPAKRRTKQ